MVEITSTQLKSIFPTTNMEKLEIATAPINKTLKKVGLTTVNSVRCFLAQIGHESGNLTIFKENLNYSEQGLRKVFSKYFTPVQAKAYARKPELIANRVYANRMGNGNEATGDGWKYRGRGAIQLTGKNNYTAFSEYMEMSIDETVEYLETIEGAILSAGWFFYENGLISIADRADMNLLTKRINGGLNGLSDRMAIFNRASLIIK